jgi:hypothetical protein
MDWLFEDADGRERQPALALNYGFLLSTPLKNFKEDKAAKERTNGRRWQSLFARCYSFDQV